MLLMSRSLWRLGFNFAGKWEPNFRAKLVNVGALGLSPWVLCLFQTSPVQTLTIPLAIAPRIEFEAHGFSRVPMNPWAKRKDARANDSPLSARKGRGRSLIARLIPPTRGQVALMREMDNLIVDTA